MSKVVMSLPKKTVKNGIMGAVVSLTSYVALQFPVAFLINSEMVGEGVIYPAVCVCACVACFLGCTYSTLRSDGGAALSAVPVMAIFLTLTAAISMCAGHNSAIGSGLVGVGMAMVAGGVVSSVICCSIGRKRVSRREKKRNKRRRK